MEAPVPVPPVRTLRSLAVLLLLAAALVLPAAASAQGFYYRVQNGDSIDVLARRFRVPAYDIARENRLRVTDRLSPGTQIWVPGVAAAPRAPVVSTPVRSTRTTATRPNPAPASSPPASSSALPPGSVLTVQPGDSLWKLATRHGVTIAELAAANGLATNSGLNVGQKLRLPGGGSSSPAVESPFESAGPAPTPTPRPSASKPSAPKPKPAASTAGAPSKVSARGYSWPVEGRILREFENGLTSKHAGLDIAVPPGTAVRAARDGVVIYAGDSISAYGRMVIVKHDNQHATCYAFNERLLVDVDDSVKRGQVIARSGEGRKGAEAYMHFQLRRNGEAVDPAPYLP